MERLRVSNDFFLDEFIPPEMYARFGNQSLLWIRPEIITIVQVLRNIFGITIINNWSAKGSISSDEFLRLPLNVQKGYFTESGLRLPKTGTGADYSMHKFGCAADLKFTSVTPDEVRKYIRGNYKERFQQLGLTRMEDSTQSWLHVDIGNTVCRDLIIIKP